MDRQRHQRRRQQRQRTIPVHHSGRVSRKRLASRPSWWPVISYWIYHVHNKVLASLHHKAKRWDILQQNTNNRTKQQTNQQLISWIYRITIPFRYTPPLSTFFLFWHYRLTVYAIHRNEIIVVTAVLLPTPKANRAHRRPAFPTAVIPLIRLRNNKSTRTITVVMRRRRKSQVQTISRPLRTTMWWKAIVNAWKWIVDGVTAVRIAVMVWQVTWMAVQHRMCVNQCNCDQIIYQWIVSIVVHHNRRRINWIVFVGCRWCRRHHNNNNNRITIVEVFHRHRRRRRDAAAVLVHRMAATLCRHRLHLRQRLMLPPNRRTRRFLCRPVRKPAHRKSCCDETKTRMASCESVMRPDSVPAAARIICSTRNATHWARSCPLTLTKIWIALWTHC